MPPLDLGHSGYARRGVIRERLSGRHDLHGDARLLHGGCGVQANLDVVPRDDGARLAVLLLRALVAHDALELDAGQLVRELCEGDGLLRAAGARATHCGVYLDEYAYGDAVLRGYLGEVVKVAGVVRADLHLGSARQGAEAGDLVAAGDLVGDEHVGYAALDHHLGLRDLSGADAAHRAAGVDLHARQPGLLMFLVCWRILHTVSRYVSATTP